MILVKCHWENVSPLPSKGVMCGPESLTLNPLTRRRLRSLGRKQTPSKTRIGYWRTKVWPSTTGSISSSTCNFLPDQSQPYRSEEKIVTVAVSMPNPSVHYSARTVVVADATITSTSLFKVPRECQPLSHLVCSLAVPPIGSGAKG